MQSERLDQALQSLGPDKHLLLVLSRMALHLLQLPAPSAEQWAENSNPAPADQADAGPRR